MEDRYDQLLATAGVSRSSKDYAERLAVRAYNLRKRYQQMFPSRSSETQVASAENGPKSGSGQQEFALAENESKTISGKERLPQEINPDPFEDYKRERDEWKRDFANAALDALLKGDMQFFERFAHKLRDLKPAACGHIDDLVRFMLLLEAAKGPVNLSQLQKKLAKNRRKIDIRSLSRIAHALGINVVRRGRPRKK
jgi:hypothetical protein